MRALYLGVVERCQETSVSMVVASHRSGAAAKWSGSPPISFIQLDMHWHSAANRMVLHTHPNDDSPLSCEVVFGRHVGKQLWSGALLDTYGTTLKPSWVWYDGDWLYRHNVDARCGVALNSYGPHAPLNWIGERAWLVYFTRGMDPVTP